MVRVTSAEARFRRWLGTMSAVSLVVLVAVVTVAGCTSGGAKSASVGGVRATSAAASPPASPADHMVPLPTRTSPSHFGLGTLGRGRLTFDGGCFLVGDMVLVWPQGYTARSSPPRILNPSGVVVARAGHVIDFGGGQVPATKVAAEEFANHACINGARSIWLVD